MTITLRYTSIDGVRSTRRYADLSKARRFAHLQIGAHPEIGRGYAVSGDGVGKVEVVEGCTLADLFPSDEHEPELERLMADDGKPMPRRWYSVTTGELLSIEARRAMDEELALETRGPDRPYRSAGCTCSDDQLSHVGCDCYAAIPF